MPLTDKEKNMLTYVKDSTNVGKLIHDNFERLTACERYMAVAMYHMDQEYREKKNEIERLSPKLVNPSTNLSFAKMFCTYHNFIYQYRFPPVGAKENFLEKIFYYLLLGAPAMLKTVVMSAYTFINLLLSFFRDVLAYVLPLDTVSQAQEHRTARMAGALCDLLAATILAGASYMMFMELALIPAIACAAAFYGFFQLYNHFGVGWHVRFAVQDCIEAFSSIGQPSPSLASQGTAELGDIPVQGSAWQKAP